MKKASNKGKDGMGFNCVTRDGKVVDIFRFTVDGASVEYEVRLYKEYGDRERYGNKPETRSAVFLVYVPRKDGTEHKFEGTDIEVLRQAVQDEVIQQNRLGWKRMLVLSVSGGFDNWLSDKNESLEFSCQEVYVGKTKEGKDIYKTDDYRRDSRIIEGSPLNEHGDRRKQTKAMIEGTEENDALVKNFAMAIVEMRKRISKFMSQPHVEQTLQQVADRMKALPGPEEK